MGWIWFVLRCGFADYVVGWVWFDLVAMLAPDGGFGAVDCVDSGGGVYVIWLVGWVVVVFIWLLYADLVGWLLVWLAWGFGVRYCFLFWFY